MYIPFLFWIFLGLPEQWSLWLCPSCGDPDPSSVQQLCPGSCSVPLTVPGTRGDGQGPSQAFAALPAVDYGLGEAVVEGSLAEASLAFLISLRSEAV